MTQMPTATQIFADFLFWNLSFQCDSDEEKIFKI